jgi:hypothetical protein
MTFRAKLKEEHPEKVDERCAGGCIGCPSNYGYEENYNCNGVTCKDCWNREMPNTEPKEDAYKEDMNTAYNKGLNDAWELASKLVQNKMNILGDELGKIFDGHMFLEDIFDNFTPKEALAKLKAYEEAQKKVEIGDVVNHIEYGNGVVTREEGDFYHVVCAIGDVICFEKKRVTKTVKHIDISDLLKQIGE